MNFALDHFRFFAVFYFSKFLKLSFHNSRSKFYLIALHMPPGRTVGNREAGRGNREKKGGKREERMRRKDEG